MNDSPRQVASEDIEDPEFLSFQDRARGTNINPQTLLATDYLNLFNEIIMTLEMVPDMPELLEEAKEWRPKSYREHFRDSTFSDRELAIEAYEHVPPRYRRPFEKTVAQMNRIVAAGIERLENEIEAGEKELVRVNATVTSMLLQKLMDHASAVIHGSERTMDQDEIDALLGG